MADITKLRTPACRATVRRHTFAEGLRLYEIEARVDAPIVLAPQEPVDDAFVDIQVVLAGTTTMMLPDGGRWEISPQEAGMFRPSSRDVRYAMPGSQRLRHVGVSAPPETVAAWFGGRSPEVLRPFLAERVRKSCAVSLPVGPALRAAAAAVQASPFHGPMRRLMLEGAALQIMAAFLDGLCGTDENRVDGLSAREEYAAREARARLLADMRDPPSAGELAAATGLSTRRLDRAFRLLFGASVFQTLQRERLEHARQVLAAGDATVSQVAWCVGYAHVASFSRAFQARFGVSPSAIRRRRR